MRYRTARRALIRRIILENLTDEEITRGISSMIPDVIKKEDEEAFTEDLMTI